MSQLANFVKKVEQLRLQTTDLSAKLGQLVATEQVVVEALEKLLVEFEKLHQLTQSELIPTCEKQAAKLNQIDPVTGEKRYGQQSIQKFTVAQESLQVTTSEIQAVIFTLKEKIEEIKPKEQSITQIDDNAQASLQLQLDAAKLEAERLAKLEEAERERKRLEEEALLHEQAERIRRRKQQEHELCEAMELKITAVFEQYTTFLNQTIASSSKVEDFIPYIQAYSSAHQGQPTVRSIWKLLLDILERIQSHPDDPKTRSLRINHPVLKTKLTCIPGCIPILILFGFRAVVRSSSSEAEKALSTADTTISPQYVTMSTLPRLETLTQQLSTHITQQMHDFLPSSVFDLLHPVTPYELWLEMEEPSMDAMDPNNPTQYLWITWYDTLKAHIAWIEQILAPGGSS